MSFFLVGKGPDGHLALLSATPVADRREALAELSRITADPEFSRWDDEVFVVDLEQGTPVLLVRPGIAPVTDDLDALVASLEVEEPAEEPGPEPSSAVEEPEQDSEPTEVTPMEAAWAEAVVETALLEGVSPSDALVVAAAGRDAAQLTERDGHMETPDSEPEPAPEVEASSPAASIESLYGVEDRESAGDESEDETPVILELATAEDADVSAPEPSGASATGADVIALPTPVVVEPAWPWSGDSDSEIEEELVLDPEPNTAQDQSTPPFSEQDAADDVTSAEQTRYDESEENEVGADSTDAVVADHDVVSEEPEAIASSDYILDLEELAQPSEAPPEDAALHGDATKLDDVVSQHGEDSLGLPSEPVDADEEPARPSGDAAPDTDGDADVDEPEPAGAPDAEGPDIEPAAPEPGATTTAEPKEAPPGYQQSGEPVVDGMTCDDCVYVETCPNKEEREPTSCGSFQWK